MKGNSVPFLKSIVGENLVAETGAFMKRLDGGGEEICEVPFVYVPNLIIKYQIWLRSTDSMQIIHKF